MSLITSISLIIFLLIRIISNPIANLFQKKLSIELSSFTINFYTYLMLSIFSIPLIFTCSFGNIITFKLFLLVFVAGLLCALGTVCLIKAVNIGELSVIGPINSYKSIIGLLTALILLKEIPSLLAILGIFLIIYGSKFIFETPDSSFSISLLKRKDLQLRFLALLLTGIEAAILKKIILLSSVEVCFIFWCFSGLLWSFLFVLFLKKDIKVYSKKQFYYLLIIVVSLGLMQYSTNYVFQRINVGYALALFQLSSLITVFLGYKLLNERHFYRKIVASLIMILGSVIIILN